MLDFYGSPASLKEEDEISSETGELLRCHYFRKTTGIFSLNPGILVFIFDCRSTELVDLSRTMHTCRETSRDMSGTQEVLDTLYMHAVYTRAQAGGPLVFPFLSFPSLAYVAAEECKQNERFGLCWQ